MVKFCPECGINLEKDYTYCPNCGFELTQVRKELIKNNSPIVKPGKSNKIEDKKILATPVKQNKLSLNKLLVIIGGLVLLIAITLYSSGIFDSPKINEMVQSPASTTQSPSVDLSKMNDIKALEDKIAANPEDAQSMLQLANLQLDSGMFDAAIVNYKKYLDKNPSDADAIVDMGICYYSLKNFDEAAAVMKKAIKINPRHQLAYINLGIVNMSAGKMDEAKNWLQKAVDIDPVSDNGKKAKELLESHK
jgi:tetratricopeptide (TPR) repeat protein